MSIQQSISQEPIIQQVVNPETSSLPGAQIPHNNLTSALHSAVPGTSLSGSTIPYDNTLSGSNLRGTNVIPTTGILPGTNVIPTGGLPGTGNLTGGVLPGTGSLSGGVLPGTGNLSGGNVLPGANILPGQQLPETTKPGSLIVGHNPILPQNLPVHNIEPSTTQSVFPYGDLPYEEPGLLSEAGHLANQIGMPVNTPVIVAEHTNIHEQPKMATDPSGMVVGQPGVLPEKDTYRHHQVGTSGIGKITFRPIEGKFNENKDKTSNMDPYCKFKIGWKSGKSSVAKGQGTHANWIGDSITLKVKNQEYAKLKVKDKDRFLSSKLGTAEIPLAEVVQKGLVTQWVPISKKGQVTGEVQVEMTFTPDSIAEPTL